MRPNTVNEKGENKIDETLADEDSSEDEDFVIATDEGFHFLSETISY
jgi:hypothetical protein